MELNQIKHQLKQVIPFDFSGAITQCEALLQQDTDAYNELINIQTQYQDAQKKYRLNHIDHAAFMQLLSRLTTALLDLVDNITEYDLIDHEAGNIDLASTEKQLIDGDEVIAVEEIQQLFSSVYDGKWKWFKEKAKEKAFFTLAAQRYGREIWRQYNSMRVFGMTEDVPLDDLFVRVNILEKNQEKYRDSLDFLHQNFDHIARTIKFGTARTTKTGIDTINSKDKMIVLGKPGAGKSTYLKSLALESIKKESQIKDRKIPIFITLKELADKDYSLMDFLAYQFDICSLEDTYLFIEHLLQKGKCLLLLDGLDEVQEERKDDIIQEVIDISEKYHRNQFVVSCRVAAYNAWFEKFADVEMADFNDQQIESFIGKWFHKEPEIGKKCWEKLKDEAPLKELASTPLLLTLLCIAYDENMDFHTSRAELYEESINALLRKWDSSRRIKRFEPYKSLSLSRKRALFSQIAAQTFEEGKYFLKRKEIVDLIITYIRNLPNIDREEVKDIAEGIFDAIVANHGIFVPRAKGIYSFAHLTFQEYFTARYISENSTKGSTLALIKNHVEDDKWREVFLLTTSMLDKADQFLLQIHGKANIIFKKTPEIDAYFRPLDQILLKNSSSPFSLVARRMCALYILISLAGDRELAGGLVYVLVLIPVRARTRALVRALALALARNLNLVLDLARARARALDRARTLARALDLDLARALTLALDLDPDPALDLDPARVRESELFKFIQIKLRLVECLHTECYVSSETRQWLIDNLLVLTEKET